MGRLDGWQGIHWQQVERAFQAHGHECRRFDYAGADLPGLVSRLLPGDPEEGLRQRRSDALIRGIRDYRATLVILHNHRFDMPRLRESTQATLAWWDVDGPAGALGSLDLSQDLLVDAVFTNSRPVLRELQEQNKTPAFYLANGVDPDFYLPGSASEAEIRRFESRLACLGRPTPRRLALLEARADDGLVLWGRNWKKATRGSPKLERCIREGVDLVGEEVLALYRCAGMMINISREPFTNPPTTLNLQTFHIPASAGCVATEWVEELEEAFEPGRELLCFRGPEELADIVARYADDPAARRRIGAEGRRRCEAHHTLRQRVASLTAHVAQLPQAG